MPDVLTFSSDRFSWHNGEGHASIRALGLSQYPRAGFRIRSHRTRDVREFEYDHGHNEENDFFDGERMSFINRRGNIRVIIAVD